MENQHRKIRGYGELGQEEIDLMNAVKAVGEQVRTTVQALDDMDSIDKRWLNIARTDLQKGFMSLARSIAKPESF